MSTFPRVYCDTETCGLYGVPVILQYAIDDGPIQIHEFWRTPIEQSLQLIRWLSTDTTVVGFNLAFDWFHIQKIYCMFDGLTGIPDIQQVALREQDARDGPCVKPASSLDLMLYAKRTDLQITMERKDVYVRRVPTILAEQIAEHLDLKIQLDPILFAGYKKRNMPRFVVQDIKQADGTTHRTLSNVVLKFRPSGALKNIAEYKMGLKPKHRFQDVELDKRFRPKERGYAPFATPRFTESGDRSATVLQLATHGLVKWDGQWPEVLPKHINHWAFNPLAREYATDDINYTRGLDKWFNKPPPNDDDSILACSVASCRWKGYRLDLPKLVDLISRFRAQMRYPTAAGRVREYLMAVMNPIQVVTSRIEESTKKQFLKDIATTWKGTELGTRAKNVLDARTATKKIELLEKLLEAGRFHPSVKVIGSLSGRMSGADGLNALGIDKTKDVRSCFPFAMEDELLVGGDMLSQEVSIADADYNDPKLREALLTCGRCNILVSIDNRGRKTCGRCIQRQELMEGNPRCIHCGLPGERREDEKTKEVTWYCYRCDGAETKSFHALFAMGFWPDMTYDEVMATRGTDTPIYNWAKNAAFATLYGAQPAKIAATLQLDEEVAQEGFMRFWRTYSVAGAKRKQLEYDFTTLYSNAMGGAIKRKTPQDSVESLLGFRRYFTLENYIIGCLYEVAENPPKEWLKLKDKIIRSKRGEQTVGNSVRSALYGAAFATQNAIVRQASNHRMQATGAQITKGCQVAVWDIQPVGVHPWLVRPLTVHDELQCPVNPRVKDQVIDVVYRKIETYRSTVPLVGIEFSQLSTWADK